MVLRKLDTHMQKNELTHLPYVIKKKKELKMDQRPKMLRPKHTIIIILK